MKQETFLDHGIRGINIRRGGQQKVQCPRCSASRKKASDPCLSVNVDEGVWNCHHCGFSGALKTQRVPPVPPRPIKPRHEPAGPQIRAYLNERGISSDVLDLMQVAEELIPMGRSERVKAIAFPYLYQGQVVNVKYRTRDKQFRQIKDAQKTFYHHDIIEEATSLIICEGEIDCLSFMTAGLDNVISVPDGAPNPDAQQVVGKFAFIEDFLPDLQHIERFYLATDNDAPGRRLREELARRLGKSRCYMVDFPDDVKDANELLLKDGPERLRRLIETAKPYPMEGVYRVADYAKSLDDIYEHGYPSGADTGMSRFDRLLKFYPGQVTTVTGIPGHGKSVFLENILHRLASRHDWKTAWYTPEHSVETHVHRLLEITAGKPFLPGYNNRMVREAYESARDFVNSHHCYIVPDKATYSVDQVLDRARYCVEHIGVRALVIDAYNQLEHGIPNGQSETNYVSHFLNKLKFFAKECGIHIFLVAHPTKMQRAGAGRGGVNQDESSGPMRYEVPTLYSISGSAHFYNVTDNGMSVYRKINEHGHTEYTRVYVQKIKLQWQGTIGFADFDYDRACNKFLPRGDASGGVSHPAYTANFDV